LRRADRPLTRSKHEPLAGLHRSDKDTHRSIAPCDKELAFLRGAFCETNI
jgi:hypothetical protein